VVYSFLLFTSYSLPATADFVGFPYQSDFFSERQNFFETLSTRTRTSSSERVTGDWWRVAGGGCGYEMKEEVTGSVWLVAFTAAPSAL
jgi:hypothetical protein